MGRTITVIIPTREREDTLKYSLSTVSRLDYDGLEIIVSDNCSSDNTREIVNSFADKRIRYINTGKRVSMTANWEFALSHVSNEWLTVIGDDDGLLSDSLVRMNEIVDETKAHAVRSATCSYFWPGLAGAEVGTLVVPVCDHLEIRSSKEWLGKVAFGKRSYTSLPMLYNGGFVSMQTIRDAMVNSKFYYSSIPDVFSSVRLAHVLDSYAFSHRPLAINGASKHSTGSSTFSRNTTADSPARKFLQEGNIPFHPTYPMNEDGSYPRSFHAILFECMAQVASLDGSMLQISLEKQLKVIMANAGSHRTEVEAWSRAFAKHNQLQFEINQIDRYDAFWKTHSLRFASLRSNLSSVKASPVGNVLQAAENADAILKSPGSWLTRAATSLYGKAKNTVYRVN